MILTILSVALNLFLISEKVLISPVTSVGFLDVVSLLGDAPIITKDDSITHLKSTYSHSIHDNCSLTAYVWKRGVPLNESTFNTTRSSSKIIKHNITIDAASMGCVSKSPWMKAQVETWGSNVRYFFGATEVDDADPTCNQDLAPEMVNKTALVCGRQRLPEETYKLRMLARGFFAQPKWLAKNNKGVGWLCAQQRFASLLGKVGKFYQRELNTDTSFELPYFLLIQDDDTYYNIDMLKQGLFSKVTDPSTPFAAGGCIVHMPIHMVNFSFPWGGYGAVLSRGAVERLIQPIYCNETSILLSEEHDQGFVSLVCAAINKDLFGEREAFENGMSISDLMRAHAALNPFRDFQQWKRRPGYCFHGDWIMGYFLNFYILAGTPSTSLGGGAVLPNFHLDSSLGYQYGTRKPNGNCRQQSACTPAEYAICHRQTPESMKLLHRG